MKSKLKLFFSLLLCALPAGMTTARGAVADDAKALMEAGDFEAAREIIADELQRAPESKEAGRLSALMGRILFEEGLLDEALPYLETGRRKGVADASLLLGRLAFMDYDFDNAAKMYAAYRSAKKAETSPDLQLYTDQLALGRRMLEHVEKVVVLDSLAVDLDGFFSAYRLPASAGRLMAPSQMPQQESRDLASMAFANEGGDFMMWAEPDSVGTLRIVESLRLTDGSWSEPSATPESLNMGGDADYPFMMADGTTLYYASDGDGSLGGYDIFIASRDAATGEYLDPLNPGMPFNSPYDDYMMAVDEMNGIGWWASDRNRIPGKLTIYVYELPEGRSNIDPDDEQLLALARLADYQMTWPEEDEARAATEELKASIARIDTRPAKKHDFRLPMPGGRVYTTWSDFQSKQAAQMMREYMAARAEAEKSDARLAQLRREYALSKRSGTMARTIAELEASSEKRHLDLKKKLSEIYRTELLR